jgi:hypothetical protein
MTEITPVTLSRDRAFYALLEHIRAVELGGRPFSVGWFRRKHSVDWTAESIRRVLELEIDRHGVIRRRVPLRRMARHWPRWHLNRIQAPLPVGREWARGAHAPDRRMVPDRQIASGPI